MSNDEKKREQMAERMKGIREALFPSPKDSSTEQGRRALFAQEAEKLRRNMPGRRR
jgi:hypothetical protein